MMRHGWFSAPCAVTNEPGSALICFLKSFKEPIYINVFADVGSHSPDNFFLRHGPSRLVFKQIGNTTPQDMRNFRK